MAITTTCIGAWPKPEQITTGQWHETEKQEQQSRSFNYLTKPELASDSPELDDATRQAVTDQLACGVDIPTDGEQRRENYIHYHCRHVSGIDFDLLTQKVHRNGAAVANLPTVTEKIFPAAYHFLNRDFSVAQSASDRPVKITVPGPLTIIDTTANQFYSTERELALDLADALNHEIRALANAGCRYIQVDEPLFARRTDDALEFGIECLERCFHGVHEQVTKVMHMCCGYPGHLDDEDYLKADPDSYGRLADALDRSTIDQVSIEDAHRHNNPELLEAFPSTTVITGVVAIATSHIESVEEIRERLSILLRHIEAERLIAAPDCGMIMLNRELAMQKLTNLCQAAATFA